MAELFFRRANDTCDFGCYSERGIMSYFMFVHLPDRVGDFLSRLQFAHGCPNPFSEYQGKSPKSTIFSELDFGNEGFGKPDGAIYVECPEPMMLLIEVKLNETYAQSCKITTKNDYNSTIKGQLELKWRLSHLHATTQRHVHKKNGYIRETPELKKIYGKQDRFYGEKKREDEKKHSAWRRLKVVDGVSRFLDYLDKCEGRVYFCAITKENGNPFNNSDDTNMPVCGSMPWADAKKQFCWLPAATLTGGQVEID